VCSNLDLDCSAAINRFFLVGKLIGNDKIKIIDNAEECGG